MPTKKEETQQEIKKTARELANKVGINNERKGPKSEKAKIIDQKINSIIKNLSDEVDIELKLNEIKKDYNISKKILRKKIRQKRKEIYNKAEEEEDNKDIEVDQRFEEDNLLINIWKELNKDHIQDDREKLATFLVAISGYLPNAKNHVSAAFKGDSSAGKDNIQLTALKHLPNEDWARATRITQSEMEDRINDWRILAISEINKNREGGANIEIAETFKQVIEDGLRIFKKDNITGKQKEIEVEQKTGFYGTTETETDKELETRYIIIPVRGSVKKNKAVVKSTLRKYSSIDNIINDLKEKDSWIAKSLRALDKNRDVVIPFAKELTRKIDTKTGEIELFDYTKERVKRDVKRLLSLTKAIAWLFQKRRVVIEKEGQKIIMAEPTDFITALKIFTAFFNLSYSGLDPRIEKTLNKIKELTGKYAGEITDRLGLHSDKKDWVIRSKLQKKLGIQSVDTIKKYINQLRNRGLIDTFWDKNHPKLYLVYPTNNPTNNLLHPTTIAGLVGCWQGDWQGISRYKKEGKSELDDIKLPDCVEDSFRRGNKQYSIVTVGGNLVGWKLAGYNSEKCEKKDSKNEPKIEVEKI